MATTHNNDKALLSYSPFWYEAGTAMYHYKDGSRPSFPAERYDDECRNYFNAALERLKTAAPAIAKQEPGK